MNAKPYPTLSISLPEWIDDIVSNRLLKTVEDRMEMIINLALENIRYSGGPFAAGIFDIATHQLIAPGINMVVKENCSILHAEIIAIMIAQRVLGTYNLSILPGRKFELLTSTEPCAMCLGAIPWSGLSRIVCGARDEDARSIGFDEGLKPIGWADSFQRSGISVSQDVCREQAQEALKTYALKGGVVYNGR
jgi:tRNA(Arg) A34 adenosine deaminase TadA